MPIPVAYNAKHVDPSGKTFACKLLALTTQLEPRAVSSYRGLFIRSSSPHRPPGHDRIQPTGPRGWSTETLP